MNRRVDSRVYEEKSFRALSRPQPNAQTLFTYLLTGPERTPLPGVVWAGKAALAEALGWTVEDVARCADEIAAAGLGRFDWEGRIIWLPKAVEDKRGMRPLAEWASAAEALPDCELKETIIRWVGGAE